jgi:hypothetical protein
MDWFERLTGFREQAYSSTRSQLRVEGKELCSLVNGKRYGIGKLELVSAAELRARAAKAGGLPGRLSVSIVQGDVGKLHQAGENAGALFQVASQFNLLEMTSPHVTPEDGVTRYQGDPTQGPACAIAAGAATIFRNYFADVNGASGQTATRQLDGLADVGFSLAQALDQPVDQLWSMRNGYAMCTQAGLDGISAYLKSPDSDLAVALGDLLRIGLHWDVEVTAGPMETARPRVSQAFCSALPVRYTNIARSHWQVFATVVLRAAYEATLCAAVCNAQNHGSKAVLLTRLGGGAFGNDDAWIHSAMRAALRTVQDYALDVRLVSYGSPSAELRGIASEFS